LNPLRLKQTRDFIFERSAMMRDRVANFDRDVRDLTRQSSGGIPGVDPSAFFAFIAYMDMGVSLPTWLGAYQKAMNGKREGIEQGDEQAAIDYADSVVRMTQAAGGAKDLALAQQGSEVWRLFTAFYSSMSVQFNQFASIPQEYAITKDKTKVIASAALLWFLPAVLEDAIRGRGPEDDDEWLAWATRKLVLYPLGTIVILRDFASALERSLESGRITAPNTAIGTIMESAVKTSVALVQELGDEDSTRADYKEAANTIGLLFALPTRQVTKTLEFWYDWLGGTTDVSGPFDFLWKTATGNPRP
jgi:hypothetical protein